MPTTTSLHAQPEDFARRDYDAQLVSIQRYVRRRRLIRALWQGAIVFGLTLTGAGIIGAIVWGMR
jgi:hypothetical protein